MAWLGLLRTTTVGALVLLCGAADASAQRNETLVGNRRGTDFGGFGGPVVKLTSIAGQDVAMSGGRGGLIINRRLVIGGGRYALARNNIRTGYTFDNGDEPTLEFGYGGLEFEYITRPSRLVHATLYTLIGRGRASHTSEQSQGGAVLRQRLDSDLFVIEPALTLELNVTRWFRTGVGAGYRFVDGSDLPQVNDAALSGGVATLSFKFGSF